LLYVGSPHPQVAIITIGLLLNIIIFSFAYQPTAARWRGPRALSPPDLCTVPTNVELVSL